MVGVVFITYHVVAKDVHQDKKIRMDRNIEKVRLERFEKLLKKLKIVLLISIMAFGIIWVLEMYNQNITAKSVQSGQVWIHVNDENNPYEKNRPRFRNVIDTNGDYLKYSTIFGDTITALKSDFIKKSRKIK